MIDIDNTPPKRKRLPSGLLTLSAALLFLAGWSAGAVLTASQLRPAELASSQTASRLDLEPIRFDDRRDVAVRIVPAQSAPIVSRLPGVLVEYNCEIGAQLTSGAKVGQIAGQSAVVLATERPLWRELGPGSRGEDVIWYEAALNRLGYDVFADDYFGTATSRASNDLLTRLDGAVPLGTVLYLPADSATVGACPLTLGDDLAGGESFAEVESVPPALQIQTDDLPADPIAYSLELNGLTAAMGADGRVTNPAIVAEFMSSAASSVGTNTQDGQTAPLVAGTLRLSEPIVAYAVPPGAIVLGVDRASGCVYQSGEPVPIRILSSSLGRSIVQFIDRTAEYIDLEPVESACN